MDPKEVFRRERQDRSNLTASRRGKTMTAAQQDSKADLRTLRGAQRTRAVPFLARFRICATENGGVCRGDADPGQFLRGAECRDEEWGGRAERIDVDGILLPVAQIGP